MPSSNQMVCVRYKVTGDADWIVVNTNLEIDRYGNLVNGAQVILDTAVGGVSYDINILKQFDIA